MGGAGTSAAAVLLLLSVVFLADANHLFGFDWRSQGMGNARGLRAGELWRALTALTLHDGLLHLAGNLLSLGFFGFLVALGHGAGLSWLAILFAGALGNLANAWIQDPSHLSLGASTAVFASIGILGGSEWRRRFLLRQRRILVWMPIVVAVWFLGLFGGPNEASELVLGRVDVFAHVLGFVAGIAVGCALPFLLEHGARASGPQRISACFALASLVAAWVLALAA